MTRMPWPIASLFLAAACRSEPREAPSLHLSETPQGLRLPALSGDHMVLQRSERARLHGWSTPGSRVEVTTTWSTRAWTCQADERGTWRLELDAREPGGPHRIQVRCGDERIEIDDVLIGDVWLCSGQSNMEMSIRDEAPGYYGVEDEAAVLATAARPALRLFDVTNAVSPHELSDCEGAWRVCDAQSVAAFSAVGYFFGVAVQQATRLPIGLVGSNWGGTRIEAWTSEAGLAGVEAERGNLAFVRDERERPELNAQKANARLERWWSELERLDPPAGRIADASWLELELPALFSGPFDGFDGVIWLQRDLVLPAGLSGSDLALELGAIDDMDTVWFDGERIAGTERAGYWNEPRRYQIPARLAGAGEHRLLVRVLDTGGAVGVKGEPDALCIRARDGIGGPRVSLAGSWRAARGIELQRLERFPSVQDFGEWHPTALYNAMIAPLTGTTFRGVLWYQGESNRSNAAQYADLMRGLVRDWRARFALPELAFYWVQIAPFLYDDLIGEAARVREAQTDAADLPLTGVAITLDVGDPEDIHPKRKQPVGERLARIALAQLHGGAVEESGPRFARAEREGAGLRVHFEHARGLRASAADGPFELAGADRVFHRAQARVDGETLLVECAQVPEPVAVRYAWCDACPGTLFNSDGLPAGPFRHPRWE
ncbi:MAG: sialate O-acetylesterase [Planctomycetes bacterium]|nr:sialate O-acetylesterase [Planctomycetota bacterium]